MKKFIGMILCVTTFFVGLGGLVEGVGAKFKSDERALELVRLARQAIGGDSALASVTSLTATGRATKIFYFEGEQPRAEQGDWELNLQLPDKLSKHLKMRRADDGSGKSETVEKEFFVLRQEQGGDLKERTVQPADEPGDKKRTVFIMKKDGGEKVVTGGEGANVEPKRVLIDKVPVGAGGFHQNELFRTTLALLLTPPQGVEVSYKYAGEASVDGASCDIIEASANGSTVRLYLDRSSHLPAMMTYQAPKPFSIRFRKEDGKANVNEDVKILRERMPAPAPGELAEFQVKFSDYRNVGGLQLPHRWTQTIGGKDDEVIEITGYELNPANIADKFNKSEPNRVFFRTAKPRQQQ